MKRATLPLTTFLFWGFLLTGNAYSQDIIERKACNYSAYLKQIDSLKSEYASNGFKLVQENSMTMESAYEMPIVVPLSKKELYSFVFIGDPGARLYEVRMYDFSENQVMYRKNLWGDVDGNIINFTYSPGVSEYHMIKPLQIHKSKKKLCGYVMLFKKNNSTALARPLSGYRHE